MEHFRGLRDRADRTLQLIAAHDRCTFKQASTIFNCVRACKSLSRNDFFPLWDACGMRLGCGRTVESRPGKRCPGITGRPRTSGRASDAHWCSGAVPGPDRARASRCAAIRSMGRGCSVFEVFAIELTTLCCRSLHTTVARSNGPQQFSTASALASPCHKTTFFRCGMRVGCGTGRLWFPQCLGLE